MVEDDLRFNFDITYVVIVIVDFASKEGLMLEDSLVVLRLESYSIFFGIVRFFVIVDYFFKIYVWDQLIAISAFGSIVYSKWFWMRMR